MWNVEIKKYIYFFPVGPDKFIGLDLYRYISTDSPILKYHYAEDMQIECLPYILWCVCYSEDGKLESLWLNG